MGTFSSHDKLPTKKDTLAVPALTTTQRDERNHFLSLLKDYADKQQEWVIMTTDKRKDAKSQIPYKSHLSIRLVTDELVVVSSQLCPVELAPASFANKPPSFYHMKIEMRGNKIVLQGNVCWLSGPVSMEIVLERIIGDLEYAYEGTYLLGGGDPFVAYLSYDCWRCCRTLAKLKRSDTSVETTKPLIYRKYGEIPRRFVEWDGNGHVKLKPIETDVHCLAFIKDCHVVVENVVAKQDCIASEIVADTNGNG